MSQVVKPDLRHTRSLYDSVKAAPHHVGGFDGAAHFTGEDEAFIPPCLAESLALSLLARTMRLERHDGIRRERNASPTMFGLGLLEDEAFSDLVAERRAHLERPVRQIYILPTERQQLSLTHASGQRHHKERIQPLGSTCLQESVRLRCAERMDL